MSLNIKNDEANRLARELAELTGETVTAAIRIALSERIERLRRSRQRKGLAKRLRAIGADCAARLQEPYKSIDHGAFLHDERGLPK